MERRYVLRIYEDAYLHCSITKCEMSEKRGKSIPSWQREDAPSPTPGTEHDAEDRAAPSDTSQASVIEKATRSLQNSGMQDAPIERKKALLKSNGLSDSETDELVGVSRIPIDPSDAAGKAQVNDKWTSYGCCKYHTDAHVHFAARQQITK